MNESHSDTAAAMPVHVGIGPAAHLHDGNAPAARGPQPDNEKAAEAFRTIGEVARLLAIRPHVLRYWEEQFPMLRPVKRSGGRRYYRPEDIDLLRAIDRLVHREGYTLRGARHFLANAAGGRDVASRGVAPGAVSQPAGAAQRPAATGPHTGSAAGAALVARLRVLRARLAQALEQA